MNYKANTKTLTILFVHLIAFQSCKEEPAEEPSPQVSAGFSVSNSNISKGETVGFADESLGEPTSWNWTFEGGNPSTSNQQNPSVTYDQEGTYSVRLEVSNATSTDSAAKEDLMQVSCKERYCYAQFSSYTKSDRIVYGIDADQHQMIIYEPEGDTETQRAAVLLFGGGGFQSGSNLDYLEPLAINLTKYGVVVAVARYRVNSSWPAQSRLIYAQQDSRTAIRFLKKEADTYGIDSSQLIAGGYSSGAFAALFHAYVDMNDLSMPEQGAIDQLGGIEGLDQGNVGYGSEVLGVISLAGGMYVTLDPITSADVPIFAVHGTDDMETPYDKDQTTYGSKPITEKAAEVGLKSELFTIEKGTHRDSRTRSDDYIENLMRFVKVAIEE